MKYYIIAGEASGDLHGSNLMKGLLVADPRAEFRFWGGNLMASVGGEMVKHYKDTAVMGFVEVVRKLRPIFENLKLCKEDILDYQPDVVILIDYPGFNFRIAKFAKDKGLRVFFYISPTVWAWKEGRLKNLKRDVDRLFIIFPFEVEYFKRQGMMAIYNGNPLLDSISAHPCLNESIDEFRKRNNLDERPIIALLAGSRHSEINYLMPKFIKLEEKFNEYQFVLAGAPSMELKDYEKYLRNSNLTLLFGETYSIMRHSKAAVLCSGTASLEAALLDTPQIVCYGGSLISSLIVRLLVKVKYASLVNLIFDQPVVKELLQNNCSPENITTELKKILKEKEREKIILKYQKLKSLLGGAGASERVAISMVEELKGMIDAERYSRIYESPLGTLKLICDSEALVEIKYISQEEKEALGSNAGKDRGNHPILIETAKQLDEYFSEKRRVFDLPVKPEGTKFQKRVWEELARIPYGKIRTYGEVASLINSKDANRAVGNACKMNPLLIVVPCHRVLGAQNRLTGFNIGIDKKSFLLNLEKAYENIDNNLFGNDINNFITNENTSI
ncbi:MAG: lipid-A-disaccharide synthase [Bacteroidetes bacterium GWF2_40_14]|nr:MAG: lipid-A-disaccharide synthase [Bacteroidetes bacterium GWF2_40_14]